VAIEHELSEDFVKACVRREVQPNVAIRAVVLTLAGLLHRYLHEHLDAALAEVDHDVRALFDQLDKHGNGQRKQ